MLKVLTAEQMRTVDRLTTERYGIPSILLMENAAHAVARVITEKLGGSVKGKSILILCGKGNNGGDGAALARILWKDGAYVSFLLFAKISETVNDARTNFDILKMIETGVVTSGGTFNKLLVHEDDEDLSPILEGILGYGELDLVVDALFGTGLVKELTGIYPEIIQRLENHRPNIISIDVPSGLNADQGNQIGRYISATTTVTFTAPKPAHVLSPASGFNGDLVVANIGSPQELIDEQSSQLFVAERWDAELWLKRTAFETGSYKNKRGHALVIAGSEDYSGAAVLAGNAAMRSGVGLMTLAVPAAIRSEVAARALPDLIVRPFDVGGEVDFAADAILIGCGLDANDAANEAMFRKIVEERTTPVIVDAGALWFLNPDRGENHAVGETPTPLLGKEGSSRELILTPHEGEFRRLLGETKNHPVGETPTPLLGKEGSLKEDRVGAVREYATANNVILVLKGERVLIGAPDGRVVVNPTGNSGLGKAGNGDTLAGILAGFVAQAVKFEIDIFETVVAAVYIAGMAGDIAEKKYGKRVMTASDVRECLTEAFAAAGEGQ